MKSYIGFKAMDMGFDAHMTLIYTGDLEDEYQEKMTRSFVEEQNLKFDTFGVTRDKFDMFGYGKVPVLRVNVSKKLYDLRDHLLDLGVPNPSDYDWNPHITLKFNNRDTMRIPPVITLVGFDLY